MSATDSVLTIGLCIVGLGCLGSSSIILCRGVLGTVPILVNSTGDGSDIITDLSDRCQDTHFIPSSCICETKSLVDEADSWIQNSQNL